MRRDVGGRAVCLVTEVRGRRRYRGWQGR